MSISSEITRIQGLKETLSDYLVSIDEADGTESLNTLIGKAIGIMSSIDTAMSDTSKNAVQNKVIKAYVDAIDSRLTDAKSAITTLQTAVQNLEDSALPVDTALSTTSENPVQNKAISAALNNTSSYTLVTTTEAEAWFD